MASALNLPKISVKNNMMIIENDDKIREYPLFIKTPNEILKIRIEAITQDKKDVYVVIKNKDKLYMALVPKREFPINISANHLCPTCSHCYACKYSLSNDRNNIIIGCDKVIDRFYFTYDGSGEVLKNSENVNPSIKERVKQRKSNLTSEMKDSKRIEKYDFILKGIESFNCNLPIFVVCNCKNYVQEINQQKRIYTQEEAKKLYKNLHLEANDIDVMKALLRVNKTLIR